MTSINQTKTSKCPDRSAALQNVLGQIEKQFGKGSIMALGSNRTMDVETISTGSLSLDIALGAGGLPLGRIVEIYQSQTLSGSSRLTPSLFAA
jgi:recombination protein RecA